MEVKTQQDVELADALVQLRRHVDNEDVMVRSQLAAVLDLTNPGWRERQDFIDRIKQVGAFDAARGLLNRYGI